MIDTKNIRTEKVYPRILENELCDPEVVVLDNSEINIREVIEYFPNINIETRAVIRRIFLIAVASGIFRDEISLINAIKSFASEAAQNAHTDMLHLFDLTFEVPLLYSIHLSRIIFLGIFEPYDIKSEFIKDSKTVNLILNRQKLKAHIIKLLLTAVRKATMTCRTVPEAEALAPLILEDCYNALIASNLYPNQILAQSAFTIITTEYFSGCKFAIDDIWKENIDGVISTSSREFIYDSKDNTIEAIVKRGDPRNKNPFKPRVKISKTTYGLVHIYSPGMCPVSFKDYERFAEQES